MATFAQIRAGLKANLDAIVDVQVSDYMLSNPSPPTIQVFPEAVTYHQAMGNGMDAKRFTVQAFVGLTSDVGAQKKLDTWLDDSGSTSVKAAIEADRTLGGFVDDTTVIEASGYKVYALEGARGPVLGCEWTVEIID